MSYVDTIKWLNDHSIQHEAEDADGNVIKDAEGKPVMVPHAIGDDIAEAAERQMTDIIGTPVFLYGFPAELKAFYMQRMPRQEGETGPVFTESCDLLMPGVGEIVGTSCVVLDGYGAERRSRWIDEDSGHAGDAGCVCQGRDRFYAVLLVH